MLSRESATRVSSSVVDGSVLFSRTILAVGLFGIRGVSMGWDLVESLGAGGFSCNGACTAIVGADAGGDFSQ